MTRPLNIETSRSSTRAAVARDEPIRRIGAVGGIGVGPRAGLADQRPVRGAHLGEPQCPGSRAGAAKTSSTAATPSPRRSIEAPSLLASLAAGKNREQAKAQGLARGRVSLDEGRAPDGKQAARNCGEAPRLDRARPSTFFRSVAGESWNSIGRKQDRAGGRRRETAISPGEYDLGLLDDYDSVVTAGGGQP